jgi:hypothetical protein
MTNQIVVVQGCNRRQCDCVICLQNGGKIDHREDPSLPVRVYHGVDRWSVVRLYKAHFRALTVATRVL